jgi:hypothetical protein
VYDDCLNRPLEKGRVFPVELQVPDFSKGTVKREVNLCMKCLDSIDKAYIRYKREQIEQDHEQGRIHEHEHGHPH